MTQFGDCFPQMHNLINKIGASISSQEVAQPHRKPRHCDRDVEEKLIERLRREANGFSEKSLPEAAKPQVASDSTRFVQALRRVLDQTQISRMP
jgi:hypothetical protein